MQRGHAPKSGENCHKNLDLIEMETTQFGKSPSIFFSGVDLLKSVDLVIVNQTQDVHF